MGEQRLQRTTSKSKSEAVAVHRADFAVSLVVALPLLKHRVGICLCRRVCVHTTAKNDGNEREYERLTNDPQRHSVVSILHRPKSTNASLRLSMQSCRVWRRNALQCFINDFVYHPGLQRGVGAFIHHCGDSHCGLSRDSAV